MTYALYIVALGIFLSGLGLLLCGAAMWFRAGWHHR